MRTNLKFIKEKIFLDYLKYWIILFSLFFFFTTKKIIHTLYSTDQLTLKLKNSIYASSGVVINKKFVITSKSIIEKKCFGEYSGLPKKIFVVEGNNIYPATVYMSDLISDMILIKLKNYEDELEHPVYLSLDNEFNINNHKKQKYIIPILKNESGKFDFKSLGKYWTYFNRNFYLLINKMTIRDSLSGFPIFNKNYVLQGITKNKLTNENIKKKNPFSVKIGVKKILSINTIVTIKNFLKRYNIEYKSIANTVNVNVMGYDPKKSVVNIICIKSY